MTMPAKEVIPDGSIIKVTGAPVNEQQVTGGLGEIVNQEESRLGKGSGVIWCKKGDPLYPYAVAQAFGEKRIANLVVRGEVVEGKDYSGNQPPVEVPNRPYNR